MLFEKFLVEIFLKKINYPLYQFDQKSPCIPGIAPELATAGMYQTNTDTWRCNAVPTGAYS